MTHREEIYSPFERDWDTERPDCEINRPVEKPHSDEVKD